VPIRLLIQCISISTIFLIYLPTCSWDHFTECALPICNVHFRIYLKTTCWARDLTPMWKKQNKKLFATIFSRRCCVEADKNKWRFSTKILLYLANDTRCGHSYDWRQMHGHSYPVYRTVPFSMTWSDPCHIFIGHGIIQNQITRKSYKIELILFYDNGLVWSRIIMPFSITEWSLTRLKGRTINQRWIPRKRFKFDTYTLDA